MRRRALLSSEPAPPLNYGTGTYDDPFLIYTPEDLVLVCSITRPQSDGSTYLPGVYHGVATTARFDGQYLKIVNNLNLSGVCGSSIGNFPSGYFFLGDLNGDNHTISNFYNVSNSTTAPSGTQMANLGGLFYAVTNGSIHHIIYDSFTSKGYYSGFIAAAYGTAHIHHITLRNGTFTPTYRGTGVVGYSGNSNVIIEHCVCESTVTINQSNQSYNEIGGICGWFRAGTIRYCLNFAQNTGKSRYHIGGIAGGAIGNGSSYQCYLYNCINFGDVQSTATLSGGIIGNCDSGAVRYCMNVGAMNSAREFGGIVGYHSSSYTFYVDGNLYLGTTANPGGSSAGPIARYGTNTNYKNYNYYTPETHTSSAEDAANKVIQVTQSNLICPSDNTLPLGISSGTHWSTDHWVLKQGFYPYPKGIENTDACLCAAAPIVFSSGNTYKTITGPVQLGTGESYDDGITWTSSDTSKMTVSVGGNPGTGETYYVGTPVATGSVTLTNWKNGKSYKRITLTITSV